MVCLSLATSHCLELSPWPRQTAGEAGKCSPTMCQKEKGFESGEKTAHALPWMPHPEPHGPGRLGAQSCSAVMQSSAQSRKTGCASRRGPGRCESRVCSYSRPCTPSALALSLGLCRIMHSTSLLPQAGRDPLLQARPWTDGPAAWAIAAPGQE